jgi:hypothetical protein
MKRKIWILVIMMAFMTSVSAPEFGVCEEVKPRPGKSNGSDSSEYVFLGLIAFGAVAAVVAYFRGKRELDGSIENEKRQEGMSQMRRADRKDVSQQAKHGSNLAVLEW